MKEEEQERNTHYPTATSYHHQTVNTNTSTSHSIPEEKEINLPPHPTAKKKTTTHHQKRLHLILIPHRHLIDVQDARVAPTLDPAVRLDGFEDRPALCAVPPVACEAVGEEEGFDGFWAGRRGVVRGF